VYVVCFHVKHRCFFVICTPPVQKMHIVSSCRPAPDLASAGSAGRRHWHTAYQPVLSKIIHRHCGVCERPLYSGPPLAATTTPTADEAIRVNRQTDIRLTLSRIRFTPPPQCDASPAIKFADAFYAEHHYCACYKPVAWSPLNTNRKELFCLLLNELSNSIMWNYLNIV